MTLSVDVSARLSLNKNLCSKSDVSTVYLVVIYAAIKCLEAKMAEYAITEEDEELVTAISSNIIALHNQYLGAFTPGQQQQQLARQRQAQGAADES